MSIDGEEASDELLGPELAGDSLASLKVYRLAVAASEDGWEDRQCLRGAYWLRAVGDQIFRALGSIRANLAEGYSRSSGRDRAHFLEYSLGSAREAREWYHHARRALPADVATARIRRLTRIVRMLLVLIPVERKRRIEARSQR